MLRIITAISLAVATSAPGHACNAGPFIIFFDAGSADISVEGQPIVQLAAKAFESCGPGAAIQVDGHTDRSSVEEQNATLSKERADAVKATFRALGLTRAPYRLNAYGSTRPRIETPMGVAEIQNRRVEVMFSAP